jgi:hypothetical protein
MLTLSTLPTLDVDPARARRIRQRCHRALGRPEHLRQAGPIRRTVGSRIVEPALVASLGAVYLFEVLRRALMMYGR